MDLKDRFLEYHLDRNHSPRTVRIYNEILTDFLKKVEDPLSARVLELYGYVSTLKRLAPASINLYIACLKSFFKWLYKMEIRRDNPAKNLENVKVAEKIPQAVTEADLKLILAKARPQIRTMLTILFYYGLRQFELFNLKLENFFETREGEETIAGLKFYGKGNKERIVELSSGHAEMLKIHLGSYRSYIVATDYIFVTRKGKPFSIQSFRTVWGTLMKKTSLSYTPHALRHGCISHYLRKGIDSLIVRKMVGHKSLKQTSDYTHFSPGDLKKLVEGK